VQWTEVVKRKAHQKKTEGQRSETAVQQPVATVRKTELTSTRRIKARPAGILIDAGDDANFPALAKKIKSGMDKNTMGNNIIGIRKTKNGGILIEVRGDQAAVGIVQEEVARAASGDATIRLLQQRTLVEIRDIDVWSDQSDVKDSIHHETSIPEDSIKVVSLRSVFGRSQTALVLLPTPNAKVIIADGRIKISVVYCRVRLAEKRRTRCYRCLAFDHEANRCKGVDRSKCCRRCGDDGHFEKDCEKDELEATSFGKILRVESKRFSVKDCTADGHKVASATDSAARALANVVEVNKP